MSMKNEYQKALTKLSPQTRERILEVVKRIISRIEENPESEPVYFEPVTYLGSDGYDERTIVAKLEKLGLLRIEGEDEFNNYFILSSLDELREIGDFIEELDREEIIKEQAARQAIPPSAGYPPSSSLSSIADRGMEEFYEDEIQLVNKLLQICNEKTKSVVLMHPAYVANSNPDKAGFDRIETLKDLQKKYKVFRSFDPPLGKTLHRTQILKAKIDFAKLCERAESLHDEVESWKGNVYGIEEQKRRVLGKLREFIRKSPHQNQEPYIYSERVLGVYTPSNDRLPMGSSLSNPDPNRSDIRYQYMRTMRELEKDGHIEILGVEFEFDAVPRPTDESVRLKRESLGERSLDFYPAKHCHVTFRLIEQKSDSEAKIIKEVSLDSHLSGKRPKCETKGGVGFVKLGSKESKPFKKLNGRQWKLAKQLIEFFGLAKTDEIIYENIKIPSDLTRYPEILNDPYQKTSRIYSIIENTIAEIQRNFAQSDLAGLFSIHHDGKKVWMDFLQ